jgi:hypothetical protein
MIHRDIYDVLRSSRVNVYQRRKNVTWDTRQIPIPDEPSRCNPRPGSRVASSSLDHLDLTGQWAAASFGPDCAASLENIMLQKHTQNAYTRCFKRFVASL